MQNYFNKSQLLTGDLYICDYTEYNNGQGVVLTTYCPTDILSFHLEVLDDIPYLSVNFEAYPSFIKGIQNCEAMAVSCADGLHKRWALFIELKYCKEDKIDSYGPKALDQMNGVRKKLIDLNLYDNSEYITHFNFCSPNNPEKEPFDGFKETQNATLTRLENEGIIFHARMKLIAVNGSLIIEPSVTI